MRKMLIIAASFSMAGCAAAWPRTELFAGIPQPEAPGSNSVYPENRPTNVMLRERVQTRFPVGSRETALVAWLEGQGLKLERFPRTEGKVQGRGVRRLGTWPCDRSVRVNWMATAAGTLETITADETSSGCL